MAQTPDSTLDPHRVPACKDRSIATEAVVVLVSVRNPLNIGAAARAMANFGSSELRVVNPYEAAFREAVSAVGGASVLQAARSFDGLGEALADCTLVIGTTANQKREVTLPLDRLEAGMERVRLHQGKVALVFGSEKFGLSNDDMSFCHALLRIPTVPGTPSMNLGQAVAVCLYELIREREPVASTPDPGSVLAGSVLAGNDAEQITRMMLELLDVSGYTNRITSTSTERKVRAFVRRMKLTTRDAPLLLGILRQVLWKLR